MKETYTIYYRKSGAWRWKKLKNVKGDGIESGCRFFHTEDDEILFFPINTTEFKYPKQRQDVITYKMSRDAGQPIQRA